MIKVMEPRKLSRKERHGGHADELLAKYAKPIGMALAAFVREMESAEGLSVAASKPSDAPGVRIDNLFMTEMAGIHLRRVAQSKGVTQNELARRMKVNPSMITRIFQHPERCEVKTLQRLSRALGVPLRDVWPGLAPIEHAELPP